MIFAQSLVTFFALLFSLFTAASHALPTTSTDAATARLPLTKRGLTGPRSLLGRTTHIGTNTARALKALPEDFMGIARDGPTGRADRFHAVQQRQRARRSLGVLPEDFMGIARDAPARRARRSPEVLPEDFMGIARDASPRVHARSGRENTAELSSKRSPSPNASKKIRAALVNDAVDGLTLVRKHGNGEGVGASEEKYDA
ncbi:hypothetical protein Hypma_013634 [Hypsizygus marmoreus]|uniref:Uncharacterized protein n=1 Tax=Hypsizygus marmoreus TaxID=39966 RepID=A0A369JBR2_HYPMA|nr:hypothetical protein Hypma_013634 [Hypsizygus marmoreus]